MRQSKLSLSVASAVLVGLLPSLAHAQAGPATAVEAASEDGDRDIVYIQGTRSSYREDETSSVTRTSTPLEDIPQSVFVITRDAIDDQAMTGLAELARYVPGLAMGQGEGHRDAPVFRGNITTSDLFVDGIRDDLQYLRDLYNVERVDVIIGPSALAYGRGAGGGAINRVSKTAGDDLLALGATIGNFGQARVSADMGAALGGSISGRLNAVLEESDSYRDDVSISRRGLAPTLRIAASDATRFDIFAEYFSDERTVDRGVPSQDGRPWQGPGDAFFGNPDLSESDIEVATLRGVLTRELTPELSFRAVVSYGDYSKFYNNVYPGGSVNAATNTVTISSYSSATDRQNLLTQADFVWETSLAGIGHTILFGFEAGRQETQNLRINTASAVFSVDERGRSFTPNFAVAPAIDNSNDLDLFAVLLQDQVELTSDLRALLGLRWDTFDLAFDDRLPGSTDFARRDEFVSPRLGLVWEPLFGLSFYGGWSQAFLPQSGDQFNSLNATRAALEPEEFENAEVGVRWQPSDSLLISATVYRLDRSNTSAPGATPGTVVLTGSQRSEGLELGIQGKVLEGWNLIGALAIQNAEITSATSSAPAGRKAPLAPEFSASLWNRVSLTEQFDVALGVVHQGEQFASISNAVKLPSYTRLDAALFYAVNDTVDLQLNVENLTGEEYWYTAHNDNNITPGSPPGVRVGLTLRH